MSINPLVAISAAQTAVRAASKLVSQLDFGEFLAKESESAAAGSAADNPESNPSHEALLGQLTEQIREELDQLGISREPPVVLELSSDGRLSPNLDHPQAAAILDRLTQSDQISQLAEEVALPRLPLRLVV